MGKALYRKHRPKKLSEVVGQEPITQTLTNALKSGQISHAYLLTGPRGTGKTSIARILAHEVNGLPYEDDATHLDIIEIDAASNRRIDEIRELRDRIHIAPTSAKYKVYIIDEVHMLTREAFNALLKTLEEPPEHAIFILATTEAHKLPDTIISRTQRFSLKPVQIDTVVDHLRHIAEAEHISIDDDALKLVAEHGQGSFRDSISLLDQVKASNQDITASSIEAALGRAPQQLVLQLIEAVAIRDSQQVAQLLTESRERAVQPSELSVQLSQVLRERLLSPDQPIAKDTLTLLSMLMDVPHAYNPQLALELALFEPASIATTITESPRTKPSQETQQSTTPEPKVATESPKISPKLAKPKPSDVQAPEEAKHTEPAAQVETTPVDIAEATDAPTPGDWQDILAKLKGTHNTLYGIARMANPVLSPGTITLEFSFPFHQKRVSEARYTQILSSTAAEVLGYSISIKVTLNKSTQSVPAEQTSPTPPASLGKITEIFGNDVSVDTA